MNTVVRVGLVGDRDDGVPAHRAVPLALALAGDQLGVAVAGEWVPTATVDPNDPAALAAYDGLWCVPASPYRSMEGALTAVRFARETGRPFLGTCGGFQHAVIEYARHVLGWADADHAETAPADTAARLVISPLACALVETVGKVRLREGSRLSAIYGRAEVAEGYRCRYGLNPAFRAALASGGGLPSLRVAAEDESGEVRALELDGHPFFIATLFQPERAALRGDLPPLAAAFVRAAAREKGCRRLSDDPAT